jgi:hypothetical protein
MNSISIGEIQKNISIITKLKDSLLVLDKRKNKKVAIIYPINDNSVVDSLAGKYKHLAKKCNNLEEAKEIAMKKAMEEKYGLSN